MARPLFAADLPGAIVYPADASNYYLPEHHGGVPNVPRAFVLHTPEEPWDDYESTPAYFAAPNRQASTHYYMDSDGDVYQLVPEHCAAIANGLNGKPWPAWADRSTSLNWQTLSVEIEGFARDIARTLAPGGPQFRGLVRLVRTRCAAWGIPLDREHVIGHYEVSVDRSDPGAGFPWAALMAALTGEEDEMFTPWSGFVELSLGEGDVYHSLRDNLHLPPESNDWQLQILTDFGGQVDVYHGRDRAKRAGQVRYSDSMRVQLDDAGGIWFSGASGTSKVGVLAVGYYT